VLQVPRCCKCLDQLSNHAVLRSLHSKEPQICRSGQQACVPCCLRVQLASKGTHKQGKPTTQTAGPKLKTGYFCLPPTQLTRQQQQQQWCFCSASLLARGCCCSLQSVNPTPHPCVSENAGSARDSEQHNPACCLAVCASCCGAGSAIHAICSHPQTCAPQSQRRCS
jgi:hypothetical protein